MQKAIEIRQRARVYERPFEVAEVLTLTGVGLITIGFVAMALGAAEGNLFTSQFMNLFAAIPVISGSVIAAAGRVGESLQNPPLYSL